MDEAEQLCDRLVVMDGGDDRRARGPRSTWSASTPPARSPSCASASGEHEEVAEQVADLADRVEVLPDRLLLYTDDGEATLARVHERGLRPVAVLVRRSTLEDVFLRLTGRTLVD